MMNRKQTMTEAEWNRCADPRTMLNRLRKPSARKLRLFGCACCRSVWDLLVDERSRSGVEAAESWADGLLTKADLSRFQIEARQAQDEYTTAAPNRGFDATSEALIAASCVALPAKEWVKTVANSVRWSYYHSESRAGLLKAEALQCSHLRCIFGYPFRPIILNFTSVTPGVKQLAETIYNARDFHRLPILADALEEAGCANGDVLDHCRSESPHVRGCWPIDLILGKS